jgi:hypothetical protein
MAIRFNLPDTPMGINCPEAYAKIEFFRGTKESINIIIGVYINEQTRRDEKERVHTWSYDMPFNEITGEFYPAMYFWLQQQAPFINNSVSC